MHGSRPFTLDVPFEIYRPKSLDASNKAPLVVALHGMGQEQETLKRNLAPLLEKPWVWLFPRGPYPMEVRGRTMRIGYAWYMFDGDQPRLRASMEQTSRHLLGVLDTVWNAGGIDLSRAAVIGFSQGGYMAGVLGAWNWRRFRGACSIAGRLKHEFMAEVATQAAKRVRLAQAHGALDASVKADAAREAVAQCAKLGFMAEYFEDALAGHEITPRMVQWVGEWLEKTL
jgi:predicted esterase